MIKHKLIINGTHTIDSTVLIGFTLSETVNDGQDLTLGSTCAAKIEFSVRISDGVPLPKYGDRITLYESNGGDFTHHGVFYAETTKRVTDRVYKVTAYDSVSKLDKDIAEWLQTVTFPISLYDLTNRAIQQCGLILANESIPNGNYQVKTFKASGITARNVCRWAGEISARFCHATDDGKISFDWYTPAGIDIAYSKNECDIEHFYHGTELEVTGKRIKADYVGGNLSMNSSLFTQSYADGTLTENYKDSVERLMYYMNSFKREAYQISPIEKVQIQATLSDIGTIFPNVAGEKNTYKITGNPLLSAENAESLKPIAEYVYNQLKNVTYTPINVVYPSDFRVKVGNTVNVISTDGTSYSAYVMNRVESGSRDSISCSGNKIRSASTAVNNQSFKSLNGKMAEIKADVGGVSVRVEEVNQSAADNLKDFSDAVTKEFDDIRNQLDGVVDTWYGEEIPTESNFPAVDWVTPQDKEKHSGDLYYVVGTGSDSGNAYRWIFLNGKWYWDKLANSDIAKALEAAAKAQDTADHKRRVFVSTPYTPYDQGDLWAQGDTGELMRCNVSRQSGAYQTSDWGPATDTGKKVADIKVTTDGITANVTDLTNSTNERFADVKITTDAISASVTDLATDTGKKFADVKVTTDAIEASVTDLAADTQSKFGQTAYAISAKVSKNGGASSFGWVLNDNSWELKSNGTTVFKANKNGAYVRGEIQASSGKIGGWEITPQNWLMGTIPGRDLRTIMAPPGAEGTSGRVFLAGGGASNNYNYSFEVYQDGTFKSTKGYIGGWTIDKTSLNIEDPANNRSLEISSYNGLYGGVNGKKWYIQMNGDAYFENATVKGTINADAGYFAGELRAETGKIGGWVIDSSSLNVEDPKNNKSLEISAINGLYGGMAGKKWYIRMNGDAYFESATIKGTIEAENGYFHGTVRAGKIEYGSAAGYVPEAGLASGTRTKLGYAEAANAILTGTTEATNIKAKILTGNSVSAATTFTFREQLVRTRAIRVKEWKPAIQQWVTCDLTVLEAVPNTKEVN